MSWGLNITNESNIGRCSYCYCLHLTDEVTKAQAGSWIGYDGVELYFKD